MAEMTFESSLVATVCFVKEDDPAINLPRILVGASNQIAERKKDAVITSGRTFTLHRKTRSLAHGELPPIVKNRIIMKFIS